MNIGDRIGDYEIVDILGAGGMGQVYKVRNVVSERIEAMKVLLPNLETDPGLADRFLREIKTQAALDDPNIAKLNTAMRVGNQLVMIMEFVDGTSIAQLLEKGPIPVAACVSYTGQILDALAYAHKQGVVHRDIKPANVMVSSNGLVKLMDFGIARMKADQRLTQTGAAVGSISYMSPEQIRGEEPDGRSDIYSLGVTLYEMVTGRRPFKANSDFNLMSAHLTQAPIAPIEIVPGVPSGLSEIILMAIAKDPAQRFQTAEAFRRALQSLDIPLPAPQPAGILAEKTAPVPALSAATWQIPTTEARSAQAPPLQAPPLQAQPQQVPPTLPGRGFTQPPPPAPIASKPAGGKRTLYMALGSLATLAVLVGAVIEGPKFMHGGKSDARTEAQSAPLTGTAQPTPEPAAIVPEPVSPPVSEPAAPEPAAQPAVAQTPVAQSPVAQSPVSPTPARRAIARPVPQNLTPTNIVAPALAPSAPVRPAEPTPEPVQISPAQAPAVQSVAPQQNELRELRDRLNSDLIRVNTAKEGLASIEAQMSRQGLGLRGDIREARTRADYQLQEARSSMAAGDVENVKQSLRYAEAAIQTIEKFLGR